MKRPAPAATLIRSVLCASALAFMAGCTGLVQAPRPQQPAAMDAAAYAALASLEYSGSQEPLERLDRAIAAAGSDPARVSAIVSSLVGVLRQPKATFDARQAVCQRLGRLLAPGEADSATLSVFAPMLADPRLVNVARLALEPVPGPAVDALFVRALEGAVGSTRLALVQSAGNRRIAAAVPQLARLLAAPDAATRDAAAMALGRIGTGEALLALDGAQDPASGPVVDARLACIANEPGRGAEALRAIYEDPRVAPPKRAAAWRALLDKEPDAAAERIVVVLESDNPVFKRVALESLASSTAGALVRQLSENLVAFDPQTQAAVIDAFARRADPAAVPAVLASTQSAEPAVRKAALAALGSLPGDRQIAMRLAEIAAQGAGEEARLARHSLSKLTGPGVNDAVLAGAERAEPALKAVFLEEVGLRSMDEGDRLLLDARSDPDASVRLAALQALAEIAPSADQGPVLAWAAGATDAREAARALRALVSVSLRNPDPAARARLVVEAVDNGARPVRLRLIPALPRIGGAAAAACAGRMALEPDAEVAREAVSNLANWPHGAALAQLVRAAEAASLQEARSAALQGALNVIDRRRGVPSAEPSDLVIRLLAVARDPETRRSLVLLLSRGGSDAALAEARSLRADPALAADAADAVLAIRANRRWPPRLTSSASADLLANMVDGDPQTAWWAPAAPNRWIQVDFGRSRPVRRVTLDQTGHEGDFPERYEVYVTDDPGEPGRARAAGTGTTGRTVIELQPGARGRYLIIRDVAPAPSGGWSVSELQVD